ncbi:MAG: RNA polymerase sporulation sigma factor SigG [Ruminococcus sp.]|nr:RNA polymerase sporulation sigma factor SigG [Ruminococcus sp.]MBP3797880.1 RNA polymerase sporulation sigma factor SigG [Ruminococcus sp.]
MQYNKVEISGVNTGQLKVLSEKEKQELLKRARNNDKTAREELINGNLRLVLSVLQRFSSQKENPDDLFQVGVVGLIKAIDNFDVELNVRFSTYAVPMILGEIKRYMRDYRPIRVSRSMRDLAYKAMQAKEAFTAKNQREPTVDEIAADIGEKRSDIVTALESVVDPISIYEPVYSEGGDSLYLVDQICDSADDRSWLEELTMKEAIHDLKDREKNILYLRFFKGHTQVEVAREIGISQAQVSRLEKSALDKIKSQL